MVINSFIILYYVVIIRMGDWAEHYENIKQRKGH